MIVLPTDSELDREKYELIRSHVYREFRLENQAGDATLVQAGVLLMAKIYTSQADEDTISLVLRKGFRAQGPKWTVLRLALALSLRQSDLPDETFDLLEQGRGSEYTLEVLNGRSQKEANGFVDAFCSLLSARHQVDLFDDEALFARWMQRHIRRGLKEIQATWRESHDFMNFVPGVLFKSTW